MNRPVNEVISDWLDDEVAGASRQHEPLDSRACEQVADSLLIHGLLADMSRRDEAIEADRIQAVMLAIDGTPTTTVADAAAKPSKRSRRFAFLTTALTAAASLLVVLALYRPHHVDAAMASLERVIETAKQPFDRSYVIRVVQEYPPDKRPRNLPADSGDREPEEAIDGAELHVRGPDKYVLIRSLSDGRQRISGYDGEQSWSFREDGPVHVSADPSRFRGGMPGQHQDLPFLDMHSHLTQLRAGYDVTLREEPGTSAAATLSHLVGVRKAQDVRGPKQVDIWFDSETGAVQRMLMDGLPRGRGGPKSVSLELIDRTDLGPSFFSHDAHHEPDRRIKHEELQP